MENNPDKTQKPQETDAPKKEKPRRIVSEVLPSGEIIEMIYRETGKQTMFVVCHEDGRLEFVDEWKRPHDHMVPLSPNHHLITKKIVLFPSDPEAYGTDAELLERIRKFIHKYLDISERFEKIASYYVLFTWVYDRFHELAYLRARGEFGSGKSRFLRVIGSLCYKPMFTGGATTSSPIFRIIDGFRGTLILDEADLKFSEMTADTVKILNSGFQTKTPVLRSEGQGTFEVKSFVVFGPKVVATRANFADLALESRFLTEEMDKLELRSDIPINLPEKFDEEATSLRNQLLQWRFDNYRLIKLKPVEKSLDNLEPRLRQIISPLLSIVESDSIKEEIIEVMDGYNRELQIDKGLSMYAQVFETVLQQMDFHDGEPTVGDITSSYNQGKPHGDQLGYNRVGAILRKQFGLKARRIAKGWIIPEPENRLRISFLKKQYGMVDESVNVVNPVNLPEEAKKQEELPGLA